MGTPILATLKICYWKATPPYVIVYIEWWNPYTATFMGCCAVLLICSCGRLELLITLSSLACPAMAS
jgi:hypothetical protein